MRSQYQKARATKSLWRSACLHAHAASWGDSGEPSSASTTVRWCGGFSTSGFFPRSSHTTHGEAAVNSAEKRGGRHAPLTQWLPMMTPSGSDGASQRALLKRKKI